MIGRRALGLPVLLLAFALAAHAQTGIKKLGPRPLVPPPAVPAAPARLTIEELTAQADVIAIGKVTEFRSEWNATRTRVFPRAVLTPTEYLKASETPETLTFTSQESGAGAARFQKDEEVLVFLRKDAEGVLQVVSGGQGKFAITKDVRTARKMVSAYTSLDEMKHKVAAAIRPGTVR